MATTKVQYRSDEVLGWYYEAYELDENGDEHISHASTQIMAWVNVEDFAAEDEGELVEALKASYPRAEIATWE